jgi:hypothetical protein
MLGGRVTASSMFSTEIFMARGHSYLWTPWLLVSEIATNLILTVACLALAVLAYRRGAGGLALLAVAFAAVHALDTWVIWTPVYGIDVIVRGLTAVAAIVVVVTLLRTRGAGARP